MIINNPKDLLPYQKLKFYTPLAMLFVSLFIVVNIVTQKIVPVGEYIMLTAGDFVYPLNYILSIILTEVYGYAMSRRVIWGAFICNIFVTVIIMFCIALPHTSSWNEQEQYAMILGHAPRLLAASFGAFLVGEFIGTYILAKTKVFTAGKYLWFRSMGATLCGQVIDSIAFTSIAFAGIVSWHDIIILSISAYWCKVIYQVLLTPGIYALARFLKKHEHVDIFDRNTNFNPFHLGLK
ncbi:MAG TPA: transporter [Coxiellaceae bacterium]|nr:transporter [Coxiellaceae bacterium]HBS51613.1 transporter [Coxiellaceae bacterium]HBY55646.1 transporter [Coxiellaceae bacterium]